MVIDNVKIASWFPTGIYETVLQESITSNNSLYYQKALEYKQKYKSATVDWRCDTYSTMDSVDLQKEPEFESILSVVKEHVIKFSKMFGVESNNLDCVDAWLNVASPGEYQEYHIHNLSHFSAVYYVHAKENSGNIVFKSQEANDMFPLPIKTFTNFSYSTVSYKPTESTLLIFRSNLQHLVCKNQSDQERVSLAMNFVFK